MQRLRLLKERVSTESRKSVRDVARASLGTPHNPSVTGSLLGDSAFSSNGVASASPRGTVCSVASAVVSRSPAVVSLCAPKVDILEIESDADSVSSKKRPFPQVP